MKQTMTLRVAGLPRQNLGGLGAELHSRVPGVRGPPSVGLVNYLRRQAQLLPSHLLILSVITVAFVMFVDRHLCLLHLGSGMGGEGHSVGRL